MQQDLRQWSAKFGPVYAAGLRRRRARAGDTWHLDKVFIKVNGVRQYLRRAVDQDGTVLDILVQSRRNATAAKRFLAKLMKTQQRVPRGDCCLPLSSSLGQQRRSACHR
jgi:putative transposase